MVPPHEDMLETEPYLENYNMSGEMDYKGSIYYYQGQYLCSYMPNYNNMLGYTPRPTVVTGGHTNIPIPLSDMNCL